MNELEALEDIQRTSRQNQAFEIQLGRIFKDIVIKSLGSRGIRTTMCIKQSAMNYGLLLPFLMILNIQEIWVTALCVFCSAGLRRNDCF